MYANWLSLPSYSQSISHYEVVYYCFSYIFYTPLSFSVLKSAFETKLSARLCCGISYFTIKDSINGIRVSFNRAMLTFYIGWADKLFNRDLLWWLSYLFIFQTIFPSWSFIIDDIKLTTSFYSFCKFWDTLIMLIIFLVFPLF
jgi:hypothetical protein